MIAVMTTQNQKTKEEMRKERLAAQLRANLRRRKSQSKARVETPTGLAERPKGKPSAFEKMKQNKD
ncbi:hypothetical protein ATL17_2108 [Maritalea mobilis]|uniref:Uncharacterized protein n=2 Tax=Maritalea mobilis TaxID=483324 RepID=A0A4R6VPF2_9HYPH|nr:hypothetical protein ATL17_2108 [Maritalea mobilis]